MGNQKYTILVADDEPDVVRTIVKELKRNAEKFKDNVNILEATTGSQVLEIINKNPIDVLVIDYHFRGGMSGDEIIDRVDDPFENILFILISSRPANEIENVIIKRHKNLGTQFRFLRKPIEALEITSKYLEIEQFKQHLSLPYPLSIALKKTKECETGQAKITALTNLIDILLRFSISIMLSNIYDDKNLKCNSSQIKFPRIHELTMGNLIEVIVKTVKNINKIGQETFMPELNNLFGENYETIKWVSNYKCKVRDQQIGHGFLMNDDFYGELVQEYNKPFKKLLNEISFFKNYQLFVRKRVEILTNDTYNFLYDIQLLMGYQGKEKNILFKSSNKLKENGVYLINNHRKVLPLDPFLIFSYCHQCKNHHLFFFDKIETKNITYIGICNFRKKVFGNDIIYHFFPTINPK